MWRKGALTAKLGGIVGSPSFDNFAVDAMTTLQQPNHDLVETPHAIDVLKSVHPGRANPWDFATALWTPAPSSAKCPEVPARRQQQTLHVGN